MIIAEEVTKAAAMILHGFDEGIKVSLSEKTSQ